MRPPLCLCRSRPGESSPSDPSPGGHPDAACNSRQSALARDGRRRVQRAPARTPWSGAGCTGDRTRSPSGVCSGPPRRHWNARSGRSIVTESENMSCSGCGSRATGPSAKPLRRPRSAARSSPASPRGALQVCRQQALARLAPLPEREPPQRASEMRVSLRARRGARRPQEPPHRHHGRVLLQIKLQDHCPMIRAALRARSSLGIGRLLN